MQRIDSRGEKINPGDFVIIFTGSTRSIRQLVVFTGETGPTGDMMRYMGDTEPMPWPADNWALHSVKLTRDIQDQLALHKVWNELHLFLKDGSGVLPESL